MFEQKQRSEATWRCYDAAFHAIAFGSGQLCAQMFARSEQVRVHLAETIWLFIKPYNFIGFGAMDVTMDQADEVHS